MTAESSLERSLSLLREQGVKAVDFRSHETFRRVLFSHVDFLGFYLKARLNFRAGMKNSRITGAAFLGFESNVLYKISASVRELVRNAIQSGDPRMVSTSANALTVCLQKAIDLDVFQIFQNILELISFSLDVAVQAEDIVKRKQNLTLFASAIDNFCSYNLVGLHLEDSPERLPSLPSYGQAVIRSLNRILKICIDRSDREVFLTIFNTLATLMSGGPRDRAIDLYSLELRLHHFKLPEAERLELEQQIGRAREEVRFFTEVNDARLQLIYYLGGWTTKRYGDKKLAPDQAGAILSVIFPFFADFGDLTAIHLKQLATGSDQFGWSLWDEGPGAVSHSWLTQFYVLASVRNIHHSHSAQEPERLYKVAADYGIAAYALDSARTEIKSGIGTISAELSAWRAILPELGESMTPPDQQTAESAQKLGLLTDLWNALVTRASAEEELRLINANISPDVQTQFIADFKRNWAEHAILKKLMKAYGCFEDRIVEEPVPENARTCSLSILEDKIWFTGTGPFAAKSVAENLGRSFGEAETRLAFESIVALMAAAPADDAVQARARLDGLIDSIPAEKLDSYVLFSIRGFDFAAHLYESERYQISSAPVDELSALNIRARYRGIPIVEVWGIWSVTSPTGICVPIREVGEWRQYRASSRTEEVTIKIEAVSEATAETLLQNSPSLAHDSAGQLLDRPEAFNRLRKRVWISAIERFSYEPKKVNLAIRIVLPPTN